jgi:pSer/pThr/pTyr-binding forkhead associated (FHA) protein
LTVNQIDYPLKRGMNLIGGDPDCDIILPDPYVSPQHLSIDALEDGTFTLIDLNSAHGLYVNGVRVANGTVLQPGDKFTLGHTTLYLKKRDQTPAGEA